MLIQIHANLLENQFLPNIVHAIYYFYSIWIYNNYLLNLLMMYLCVKYGKKNPEINFNKHQKNNKKFMVH